MPHRSFEWNTFHRVSSIQWICTWVYSVSPYTDPLMLAPVLKSVTSLMSKPFQSWSLFWNPKKSCCCFLYSFDPPRNKSLFLQNYFKSIETSKGYNQMSDDLFETLQTMNKTIQVAGSGLFSQYVSLWQILQGGNSKNFLSKFVRFFLTLGLKILRLQWLKVVFEADINKSQC